MDIVSRDTWRTSLIAVAGVTLLTVLVFRWKSHSWLVLATLATGVVLALGAVRMLVDGREPFPRTVLSSYPPVPSDTWEKKERPRVRAW